MKQVDPFKYGKFDVEHVLNMYATSYSIFPAQSLYNQAFVDRIRETSESFHIYLIGFMPKISQEMPRFENGDLIFNVTYMGKPVELKFPVPSEFKFVQEGDQCRFEDKNGQPRWIDPNDFLDRLSMAVDGLPFLVKYIGQSYGQDGSRDAIDRLLKHETLQRISIKGIPEGYTLHVVLFELLADNRVITVFLPDAEHKDDNGKRRKMGIDKLFDTTEAERVSVYEASLIRYFEPEFNKEFKNSFPSTNLKILQDCYDKDFLAVVAEICFDNFPFDIYSEKVERANHHIITHDIQKDSARKVFFGLK